MSDAIRIWECDDCGFQMNSLHLTAGLVTQCPNCELEQLREKNDRLMSALEWIETEDMLDPENLVDELRRIARVARMGGDPSNPDAALRAAGETP